MCMKVLQYFFKISLCILLYDTIFNLFCFCVKNKKFSITRMLILIIICIKINRVISFDSRSSPIGCAYFSLFPFDHFVGLPLDSFVRFAD